MSESPRQTIDVRESVLARNQRLAQENRDLFRLKGVRVLNVLSAPGSGKTSLLQRTLTDLRGQLRAGVIVGDLATDNDARRLQSPGARAVQVTTGTVCHLEAAMVSSAAAKLGLDDLDILFIENVGNLVCPAAFDLGEDVRVALMAVTEGEDKPLKYPRLFKTSNIVIITKSDMADAAGFQREQALDNLRQAAPQARVLELSARTGQGMKPWYDLLLALVQNHVG